MDYYKTIKEQFIDNINYKRIKDYSKNKNELFTYYNVGKILVEAQGGKNKSGYGDYLIKQYSIRLTNELGKGYSITTLKRMRQFYIIFEKGASVMHQLSWTHYVSILSLKNKNEINYYINICIKENLSVRELRNRIKLNEFNRLSFIDKEKIEFDNNNLKVSSLIKNPIIIKGNNNVISEKVLKELIIENLDDFLHQLGNNFSYIGNEIKINIGDRFNYIDILLFNIEFDCYVVVELKITEFKAEYIGQVKKYMNYVDKNISKFNHNNTIGIIICKKENKYVLEYISDTSIFTTTYELIG